MGKYGNYNLPYGNKNPSEEVIQAVEAAIAWFDKFKIERIRIKRVPSEGKDIINHECPYDNVVVKDENAPAIWSRFYELSDNRPFMAKRSGEKVWKLSDVNAERRTGYDWYGYWPVEALKMYEEWKKQFEH